MLKMYEAFTCFSYEKPLTQTLNLSVDIYIYIYILSYYINLCEDEELKKNFEL